jgi:hypothetical protein
MELKMNHIIFSDDDDDDDDDDGCMETRRYNSTIERRGTDTFWQIGQT